MVDCGGMCGWDHSHCARCSNEIDGKDPPAIGGQYFCRACEPTARAIAKAVMSEREACANLAEHLSQQFFSRAAVVEKQGQERNFRHKAYGAHLAAKAILERK